MADHCCRCRCYFAWVRSRLRLVNGNSLGLVWLHLQVSNSSLAFGGGLVNQSAETSTVVSNDQRTNQAFFSLEASQISASPGDGFAHPRFAPVLVLKLLRKLDLRLLQYPDNRHSNNQDRLPWVPISKPLCNDTLVSIYCC